jgi:hypothetical protein
MKLTADLGTIKLTLDIEAAQGGFHVTSPNAAGLLLIKPENLIPATRKRKKPENEHAN